MEIIDFRVRPQTEYFYRNIYPKAIPAFQPYVMLFKPDDDRLRYKTIEDSIEQMKGEGINRAVIFGGDAEGNKEVYEVCKKYPDTYIGLAGIDISQGITKGVKDLEIAYNDYGLSGLSMGPFVTGIYPNDSRYYPLYALSERMGKVLQCHSAIHFNPTVPIDISNPAHLDELAVDFPGLRIVMSHAGYGFGDVGITVALRHPNMFIDLTGIYPKYIPDRLMKMTNTVLSSKAIFGTNFPCLSYDTVHEWKKYIREQNHTAFFAENAKRALGIS